MRFLRHLIFFTLAGALTTAFGNTILDTGSGPGLSVRGAGEGSGQGVTFTDNTEITSFGLEFAMPQGGLARFMIWDIDNSSLLYNETSEVETSDTPTFRMTSALNSFIALAGQTYFFGVIGDAELDLRYFFPPLTLTESGLTVVTDGNMNYLGFGNPVADDTAGATLALRLVGAETEAAVPEPSTWATLITGLTLMAIGRYRR